MKTPQQLSHEAIEKFKAIYQEEFREVLSDGEVQEVAMRLLRFLGIMNKLRVSVKNRIAVSFEYD